jgi:hypothetical protein
MENCAMPSEVSVTSIPPVQDSAHPSNQNWKDVWSRPGRKYRIQAILLFAVNLLLFAGVACFAFWLRSGVAFAPAMPGYRDQLSLTFNFTASRGVSLGSLLLEPISVQDVPMQILILGLLMATLIAIPILVSILYRFWFSLPLLAIVAFLAVKPWLAITLMSSCLIASSRPLRTPFRFMSALLGLMPVVAYLFLAASGTRELVAGRIDPVDSVKFVAPWILTIVAAAALFAIVLAIARLVDFRSGAVTPLLMLMFVLPVLLFEYRVGRDELHYRLLEALAAAHFEEVDASADLERAVQRAWERHPLPRPRWQDLYEIEAEKWQMALAFDLDPFHAELARHQAEFVNRVDRFIADFPDSRYAANALYLRARALDMRLDAGEFRRTRWVRYYDDFPSNSSRLTWQLLLEYRPDSAAAAVGWLRLARLEKLFRLMPSAGLGVPGGPTSIPEGVMARPDPETGLHIDLERIVFAARMLYNLVNANRDPVHGYDPLCGTVRSNEPVWFGLLDLDPRSEWYAANLKFLRQRYPASCLNDNLDLEVARTTPGLSDRIERLEQLLKSDPRGDAAPEAMFRLTLACIAAGRSADALDVAHRLIAERADSIWATEAARTLRGVRSVTLARMSP